MASYKFVYSDDYLSHHGIKGQKWGVRRFQNEDGSLTEAGQKRYNKRKEYIDDLVRQQDKRYKRANRDKKYYKQQLKELNDGGQKSKHFKSQLHYDEVEKVYYNGNDEDSDFYKTKKEAYDGLKQFYEKQISRNTITKDEVKEFNALIEKYKSFPITERTFIDNIDKGKKAFMATWAGLEALEVATIVSTNSYLLGALSIAPRQLMNFSASLKAEKAVKNLGVKKEYREK